MSAITPAQARALRNASDITFHYHEGRGFIRAHKRANESDTGFDQYVEIPARDTRIEDYDRTSLPEGFEYSAFHMTSSAQFDSCSRTIVQALRAGREFVLEWQRDNRSPVTEKAGVVRDELRIRVGVEGKRADAFLVAVQVGLDNSARMVRRVS